MVPDIGTKWNPSDIPGCLAVWLGGEKVQEAIEETCYFRENGSLSQSRASSFFEKLSFYKRNMLENQGK